MSVLLSLTLLYVVVLIVALAAGLIAIAYYLNRARSDLRKIASGLGAVDANVAPLKTAVSAVNTDLEVIAGQLAGVDRALSDTHAKLDDGRMAS